MSEVPKCYSYIRFSRPEQSNGNSTSRQREKALEYANKHNLSLDNELSMKDAGLSAFRGMHIEKGALGAFLALIKAGKVPKKSVLIIEALDRLTRQEMMPAVQIFTDIINNDIKIITANDGVEYSKETISDNPFHLMMGISILNLANRESQQKSERLCSAWNKKRDDIKLKKLTGKCPAWLELSPDKTHFSVKDDRGKIVNRIFDMSNNGIGIKSIARQLNIENIPEWHTRKRKTEGWQSSYIFKILKNRAVLGEYQPHKFYTDKANKRLPIGEPISDYFPPVINQELYGSVQTRLKSISHAGGKTGKISNLFGSLAKCGYCNGSIQIVDKGSSKSGKYLVCDNARRKSGTTKCEYHSVKYNEIEEAFLTFCTEHIDIENIIKSEQNEEMKKIDVYRTELGYLQNEYDKTIKSIELNSNNIMEVDDIATVKHLTTLLNKLISKRTELSNAITLKEHELNTIESELRNGEDIIANITALNELCISNDNEKERVENRIKLRNQIRCIIVKIVLYPVGQKMIDAEQLIQSYDADIGYVNGKVKKHLQANRQAYIEAITNRKPPSRDGRFFTVYFKNGNYRHIKYSKKFNCYQVVKDKTGSTLSLLQNKAKDMISFVVDENEMLERDIAYAISRHPDMDTEQVALLRTYLALNYE